MINFRKIVFGTVLILSVLKVAAQPVNNKLYLDENKPIEERIENVLSQLTLEEKVDLCHAQSKFSSKGVARLGIPELWMSDGPFGIRAEVLWDDWAVANFTNDSCMAFPALTCLAASFNPHLAEIYGKAVGEEARYRKKSVVLGPGVNIYRTPLNGRNFEYMGEDPFLASKLVVPYIHGLQSNGVAACVKHFALNNQEMQRDSIEVHVSDRALHEIYFPAFKAAVEKGKVWSLMGAYNLYNGEYCCHNDLLLNKVLKGDWKFDGAVISDWNGVHNTYQAALNGTDIEMGTYTDGLSATQKLAYSNYYLADPFLKKLKDGTFDESIVNEKVRRILRLMFRTEMNRNRPWGSFATEEHAAVCAKVGEEGMVLLKNENQLLPLDLSQIRTIAVIGENADRMQTNGGGSSTLKAKYEITPLQGLKNRIGNQADLTFTWGYSSYKPMWDGSVIPAPFDADSLKREALLLASKSDVVLFFGGLNKNRYQDCEGFDRETYDLPYGQAELIKELSKVNKKIILVLISGTATDLNFTKDIPAVLQAWFAGSESGNTIARVLFGDVNPSGKLPFSYPAKLTDCGANYYGAKSYPGIDKHQEYMEDILVGYRWLDTKDIDPVFAFGHGLSYTSFQYGKAHTDKSTYKSGETVKLTFTLSNTGQRDGAEVSQVYITQKKSPVKRPTKELKGFSKIMLKRGETKTVTVDLPVDEWAYYDETTKSWKLDEGEFVIQLGASSRDIKQKCSVKIL